MGTNNNENNFCIMCGGKMQYNSDEGVAVCSDCGFELVVDAPKDLEKVVETPKAEKAKSTKSKSAKSTSTKSKSSKSTKKSEPAGGDEFCIMCGNKLVYNESEGVATCPECGFELVVDAPKDMDKVVDNVTEPANGGDDFCIMCGNKLVYNADEGVAVCPECGFELVVDAPKDMEKVVETTPVKESAPKKKASKKEKEVSLDEALEGAPVAAPVRESTILLQCQNCGGAIDMIDSNHGVCKNCKSKFFFDTNLSDEIKTMLNEANKDRRMAEYDRAIVGYEDILKKDKTNAEAYFGLFISEYGIRFVEDTDGKHIPTCDRFSNERVYDNENYKCAIEYASSEQLKARYKYEADRIEKIRLEIAEKVKRGESYDIFICYKQSELNSDAKTKDSRKAWDIWKELTKLNYKVFLAEESLKPGEEYEPVIFTALSTAKVLLLVTSKTEYANATWVKNEWSRYLKMIKNGEKESGSLIPVCVDGFEPYNLPLEIKNLQAVCDRDINFFDVLRDKINKLANTYRAKSTLTRKEFKAQNFEGVKAIERDKIEKRKWAKTSDVVISATEEGELKNAYNYLSIGKFTLAGPSFVRMIEKNAQNDSAIFGLEMTRLKVKNENDFAGGVWYNYNYTKQDGQYKLPEFEKFIASANTEAYQTKYMDFFYKAVVHGFAKAKLWAEGKKGNSAEYEKLCAFIEIYLSFNNDKANEKDVIKRLKDVLDLIVVKQKDNFSKIAYANQAAKKYPALDLWFVLFETYLKTIDAKDVSAYSNVVFKAMSQLCGSIRDVRLIKYIDQLIQMMPNAIGIRMLRFLYEYGCENYFVSKSFNQIKKMIDTVLPYDEENIDFVHELMKHVDNLMFVYKKYSLGFKVFEHIVSYISKKYDNVLCDYLVYMGNIALFLGTYNETAKKYFNNALSVNPKDSRAHWGKLKTEIGIRDDFYLQLRKKDYTVLESCQNAINCSESSELNAYYMAIIEQQVQRQEKKRKPYYVKNPIVESIFKWFPCYKDYYCKEFLEHYAKHDGRYLKNLQKMAQTYLITAQYVKKDAKGKTNSEGENYINSQALGQIVLHNERDAVIKAQVNSRAKSFRITATWGLWAAIAIIVLGVLAKGNSAFAIPTIVAGGLTIVLSLLVPAVKYSGTKVGNAFKWILISLAIAVVAAVIIYLIVIGVFFKWIGWIIGGAIGLFVAICVLIGFVEGIKESW